MYELSSYILPPEAGGGHIKEHASAHVNIN